MRISMLFMLGLVACAGQLDPGEIDDTPPNADPLTGCSSGCHGADASNAPPMGLSSAADTTAKGVGAHQAHLVASPSWHRKVECADCHVVPQTVGATGHLDGDNKAEVVFSARAGGAASSWNGTTCTAGCHGSAAWGGTSATPNWTRVDGTQSACGSCHGAPPPAPHPTGSNCAACHPTMEENSLSFRDPDSHINGKVDVVAQGATGGCTSCHGQTNSAPPKDLKGNTAATVATVGAHQAHLKTSDWHHAVVCTSCHVVPQTSAAPGHLGGDNIAEVKFDALNPLGVYSKANATCSTMYCHGNGRGGNGTVSFTRAGPLACNACHSTTGQGMSGRHSKHINGEGMRCNGCHADVVNANLTILKADLHINGVHEIKMAKGTWNATTRSCSNTGCHGTERW